MTGVTLHEGDGKANGVEFDDATDTCTVAVDVAETDDDHCTQQVTTETFTVEATFAGGLPGTVDNVGPN